MLTTIFLALALQTTGDSFPSGPPVGDKLGEFKSHALFGPEAGKDFKVIEKTKGAPTLLIFVHQITRPGLKFLRPIDKYAGENEKLAAHVVWLTEDKDKTTEYLKRAEKSLNLQTPISICLEGKDGPAAYGLNDKVMLTVLIAREGKVVGNFALVDPNDRDSEKVLAALKKVMGMEKK